MHGHQLHAIVDRGQPLRHRILAVGAAGPYGRHFAKAEHFHNLPANHRLVAGRDHQDNLSDGAERVETADRMSQNRPAGQGQILF